jgi:glycosyltransferase involved in cell wall biosynthesis
MRVCHIREFTYPVIKSDGVGALILKISNYMLRAEHSQSSLITRNKFGLPKSDKLGNIDVCRVGLEPSAAFSAFPKVGWYSRRILFSIYSKDARFLFSRTLSLDGISAIKKLADEAAECSFLKDVDVFHCHGIFTNFETYIGLSLSRRFQKPIMFQIHGHFGSAEECMGLDQEKPWYDPVIGNKALNESRVIICGNKSTVEMMKLRTGDKVKIAFIPTCVDTSIFYPENKTMDAAESILFMARLTNFKDPITPVRAMKIVAEKRPEAKLKIVGGGPLLNKLQLEIEKLGLEKNVFLFGEQVGVRNFFRETSVFLSPSPVENFLSNSLLEAMASGLAIVATDVGETRNLITDGENGILIKPRGPRALANAVLSLISDQELHRNLSRNAIETAKQYDINVAGPKYANLYKEVLL